MAAKLPWFKLFVQDFLLDDRVVRLTNEQRGVYLWLLCRQWVDGDLPFDVMQVYPLMPYGSDSAAVAFVLSEFFPPDPDTNRRRNPKLAQQQESAGSAYEARVETAGNARKARARKSKQDNAISSDQTSHQSSDYRKNQNQILEPETDLPRRDDMIDPFVFEVAAAANQALRDNPQVRNAEVEFTPLKASSAQQAVADWLGAGIPQETILKAVAGVCARYSPTPENRRIGSWRYFDQAVLRAHAETQPDPMQSVIAEMQKAHEAQYGKDEAA